MKIKIIRDCAISVEENAIKGDLLDVEKPLGVSLIQCGAAAKAEEEPDAEEIKGKGKGKR